MTEKSSRLYTAMRIISFISGVLSAGLLSGGEPILLKAGTIHPESDGELQTVRTKSVTQKAGSERDRGLYIIQSESRITPVWRASLVKTGARILRYIPENAYLIEATEWSLAAIRESVKNAYLGEYLPEYRLSQVLAEFAKEKKSAFAANVKTTSSRKGSCFCSVCLFSRDSLTEVVQRVEALHGCRILAADGAVVRCELTAAGMAELTALPEVEWIEEWHQPTIPPRAP